MVSTVNAEMISPGRGRQFGGETDPRGFLQWTTPPLPRDLDMIGPIELQLDATCTAPDTAFIAVLQDIDENGNAVNVTSGYLRAGLRAGDLHPPACKYRGAHYGTLEYSRARARFVNLAPTQLPSQLGIAPE